MTIEIKSPTFPESVADGTVANWVKKEGESVAQDEILAEIETDKVVLEVVAPSDGVLTKIIKNEGDIVNSAEVIGQFDETAEHEIGHNLTLDHSDSGLMNDKGTFGNKNVTKDEKGEIVSGQINPKDGNGVYKDSQLNLSGHYKKPIKSQIKDFMKKHTHK